jgi:NAD(P)H-dependent FMN reductase
MTIAARSAPVGGEDDASPPPHLQIIVGSTRPGRRGTAVGTWLHRLASGQLPCSTELVELAELGLPLLDEPLPAQRGRYEQPHTKRWSELASRADAYVWVVPEYNHSFNAATKNALDFLAREWAGKPVAFVGYGGVSAGARAVQALVPVAVALGMRPLSRSVNIPGIRTAVGPDGVFRPEPGLDENAQSVLAELVSAVQPVQPVTAPAGHQEAAAR